MLRAGTCSVALSGLLLLAFPGGSTPSTCTDLKAVSKIILSFSAPLCASRPCSMCSSGAAIYLAEDITLDVWSMDDTLKMNGCLH